MYKKDLFCEGSIRQGRNKYVILKTDHMIVDFF